jgi:Protein of unknown function (DUF4031)
MTVLIDQPMWPAHGTLWSHLVSDSSLEELHAFAEAVGLPARSFDLDHYDVPAERYDKLVAAGAEPVSIRGLVTRLQSSGLRVSQRERRNAQPGEPQVR